MDVETLLKDLRPQHSKFQMRHSITATAGGTLYGMLQQALCELDGRHGPLGALKYERDTLLKMIAKWSRRPHRWFAKYRRRVDAARVRLAGVTASIKHVQYEYDEFVDQATVLKEHLGEIDEERANQLDEEMWFDKLERTLALDIMLHGCPSPTTIESIIAAPFGWRKRLMDAVTDEKEHPGALAFWLMNRPTVFESQVGPLRLSEKAASGNGKLMGERTGAHDVQVPSDCCATNSDPARTGSSELAQQGV